MTYYLYVVSAPTYFPSGHLKLGLTENLCGRRSQYLTGCPPGLEPSCDLEYYGVWETCALTNEDLVHYEELLHHNFRASRRKRNRTNDSEWFSFSSGEEGLTAVRLFLSSRPWIARELPLSEIAPLPRPAGTLNRVYIKNTRFLRTSDERLRSLINFQSPVITIIKEFFDTSTTPAAWFSAPCGAGKTVMTAQALKGSAYRRVIICCPRDQIQRQWAATLVREGVFTNDAIQLIGGEGTTNPEEISEWLGRAEFCIITTYISSNILEALICDPPPLFIFDEAHHLAGVLPTGAVGEGRTRRLLQKIHTNGWKRLSMTYTPRIVYGNAATATATDYYSMDDEAVFGPCIAQLKLRELINAGVLPDYRIWTLHDAAARGEGIRAKGAAIMEAWGSTELRRDTRTLEWRDYPMLNHLIVFTANITEAAELLGQFREIAPEDTVLLQIRGEDSFTEKQRTIRMFESAPRAILINVYVLGEGVDIPITDSVAFACSKHARGQIAQMILRAGRWSKGKPLFHILLPVLDEADFTGFRDVLTSMAESDEQLRDEIFQRVKNLKPAGGAGSTALAVAPSVDAEELLITQYEGGAMDEIQRCFRDILALTVSRSIRQIQPFCIKSGVDTSVDYADLRRTFPEFPESPLRNYQTWYEFLHPAATTKIAHTQLATEVLLPNGLLTASAYDSWLSAHPESPYPSSQHILDGYYATEGIDSYTKLCAITRVGTTTRGRGGRG